jgi:hypothetical protein
VFNARTKKKADDETISICFFCYLTQKCERFLTLLFFPVDIIGGITQEFVTQGEISQSTDTPARHFDC